MRIALLAGCAAVLLSFAGAAVAQQPSAPAGQDTPPAPSEAAPSESAPASPPAAAPAAPSDRDAAPRRRRRGTAGGVNKRRECRQEARQRGLSGQAAADHAMICLAEARLECTKQAVAQVQDRRERNAFIRECMGQRARQRPSRRQAEPR